MDDSEDFYRALIELQGRIVALETLTTHALAGLFAATNPANKREFAERMRRQILSSAQNLSRPVNDEADAVWEAAAMAMTAILDNIVARFPEGE